MVGARAGQDRQRLNRLSFVRIAQARIRQVGRRRELADDLMLGEQVRLQRAPIPAAGWRVEVTQPSRHGEAPVLVGPAQARYPRQGDERVGLTARAKQVGGGDGVACDTMSHVMSELVEEVWLMPGT